MSADNHDIRKGREITFADDVTRNIRPLSIRQLRRFVKLIEKLGDTSSAGTLSDDEIDTMVDAAAVILEKVDPMLAEDRDKIEDVVDLLTFNDMMTVAMGVASPEE